MQGTVPVRLDLIEKIIIFYNEKTEKLINETV